MRRIVYWGAGNIGKQCFLQHKDVVPVFFIDSFSNEKFVLEKEVKKPDEIEDWSEYFIVITVRKPEDIEKYLIRKGLCKEKDYIWYEFFFSCSVSSVIGSVQSVQAYINSCSEKADPILIVAPVVGVRKREDFQVFLKTYSQKRQTRKVLLFSTLFTVSSAEISEKTGCITFGMPDIGNWDGSSLGKNIFSGKRITDLSKEETAWLREMENRKISSDPENAFLSSQKVYCYFDTIIEIVHPVEIIIWSGWLKESYILGHIAEERGIPHGYMEHGWIPGTNQFDPCGIAGQGECAVNPDILEEIFVDEKDIAELQRVKQYVIENQIDTRTFIETEEDNIELKRLMDSRKTVLLVGMDEKGMSMNPQDIYWEKYISSVYRSMEEVLLDLVKICEDNGYNLIFKPHPGEQPLDINNFDRSKLIYVKDISIDKLIQKCDVAVSMASAVDYKVLMYGKPLVQVGITGLKGKKCSYEVKVRNDLENKVKKALREGMTEEQKKNYDIFLARLLKRYLWDDMSEKKMISYGLKLDTDFCGVK